MQKTIFDPSYPVTKMHGCGNDFVVYVDLKEKTTPDHVKKICAFHTGIGADGVITVAKSRVPQAKYRMKYFNADGSLGEMCGNGIRCFAKYLLDNKFVANKEKIPVDTDAGIIIPEVLENTLQKAMIRVNMGKPVFYNPEQITAEPDNNNVVHIPFPIQKTSDKKIQKLKGTYISMGNPHIIFFVEKGLAENYAKEFGPQIEYMASLFPQRVNVEFVEVNNKKDITVHVWERGCGLTLACGTGACATLVASVLEGFTDSPAKIHLPGGTLEIEWKGKDAPVFMTGPAVNVYTIQNLQDLHFS